MPNNKAAPRGGANSNGASTKTQQPHDSTNSAGGGNGHNGPNPEVGGPAFDPAKANAAANDLFEALATQPELRAQVHADYERRITEHLQPPDEGPAPEPPGNGAPDLPADAQLPDRLTKDINAAGAWWTEYIDFAAAAAPMTPPEYHAAIGLSLLSAVVARRVKTTHGFAEFFPNLYLLNIGPSTIVKKSSAQNIGYRVLADAGQLRFKLSESVTPEGLIDEMTGDDPKNFSELSAEAQELVRQGKAFAAQKVWWIDEASALFNSFDTQYLAPLREFILRLYDCPPQREFRTRNVGLKIVKRPYLTIFGTSTYAAMRRHLKNLEYWTDGIFARFVLITPSKLPLKYDFLPDRLHAVPPHITGNLAALANKLPDPSTDNPCLEVELEDGVKDRWRSYGQALEFDLIKAGQVPEQLQPSYGRLKDVAIKTAMLLAASDWAGRNSRVEAPRVTHRHYARGQIFAESCRLSLHRLLDVVDRQVGEDAYERIAKHLRGEYPLTVREINQKTGLSYADLERYLEGMARIGMAVKVERKGARGRSAIAFLKGD